MCPECKSANISRSKRWRVRDTFMLLLRMKAYRCRDCRFRFYLPARLDKQIRRERDWLMAVHSGNKPVKSSTQPVKSAPPI